MSPFRKRASFRARNARLRLTLGWLLFSPHGDELRDYRRRVIIDVDAEALELAAIADGLLSLFRLDIASALAADIEAFSP